MDANRFDALAKTLISETNRRRALRGLLGGAVSALGLARADDAIAAKSGECKKECDLCEFCQLGKCRRTKSGRKRCKSGKCKRQENGTPCASVGGICQNGGCVCPDGRENCGANCCLNNQICQNSVCACPNGLELCNGVCVAPCPAGISARNPDTCGCCRVNAFLPFPCNVPFPCCSEICVTPNPMLPNQTICVGLGAGDACDFDAQCDSGDCGGGSCQP